MGQKQSNTIDLGGTIISVLQSNQETFNCQESQISAAYTALSKDAIQCNVEVQQTVEAMGFSCAAEFLDGNAVSSAISSSVSSVMSSLSVNEYNGSSTNYWSQQVADQFVTAYSNNCSEQSEIIQSLVLQGDTISCCTGWSVTPQGLSCSSLGTLTINQTVVSPRLQCALDSALQVIPPPNNSQQQQITQSNTPADMPWYVFVLAAVALIAIAIVILKVGLK